MTTIRVLMAALPRMLHDLVAGVLAAEPDIAVVGEVSGTSDLVSATRRSNAHVVLLGLDGEELPAVCDELLCAHPGLTVLAVTADGRQAISYRLRPERGAIDEVSARSLVDAVRASREVRIC